MPHAIIVVGNERRFMDEARTFAKYLRSTQVLRITMLRGAYFTPKELKTHLRRAISFVPNVDALIVAYFGHGIEGAWSYAIEHERKMLRLSYKELAADLTHHSGPLAILNDCCHAASLEPYLEKAGISPNRCMLISACAADELTSGACPDVLAQWRQNKTFEPVCEREEICYIDKWRYTPSLRERASAWWHNAMILVRNLFRPARRRQPLTIRHFSPPNGWGIRHEIHEETFGRRWGTELDHLFFPKL